MSITVGTRDKKELKRDLKDVYTDYDMSQADLAKLANVGESTISRVRSGDSGISMRFAKRIVRVLNAKAKEFDPQARELTIEDIKWTIV